MNKFSYSKHILKFSIKFFSELFLLPLIISISILARFFKKKFDIGIGPEPLINNIYHAKALRKKGYNVETFVNHVYYVTDNFDRVMFCKSPKIIKIISNLFCLLFFSTIFRYRAIYIYFNGGALLGSLFLWRIEPWLYKIANVKVVVMPYGGDIQNLALCPNLLFKHVVGLDYPNHRKARKKIERRLDLWTNKADHIISGCDWVDYMHYWDTLMLSHFSIEINKDRINTKNWDQKKPLKILHAPNHENIKGTKYFLDAINELNNEGYSIKLIIAKSVTNNEIQTLIDSVDLVADQLIIGWYAMFSIEAMAAGKPVICYLREDLLKFYEDIGLVNENEIPIIQANLRNIKEVIIGLIKNPEIMSKAIKCGPQYVNKFHSLDSVGKVFDRINKSIGINSSKFS